MLREKHGIYHGVVCTTFKKKLLIHNFKINSVTQISNQSPFHAALHIVDLYS